jgi:hypothetical protein
MKNYITAIVFSLSIVLSSYFLADAYLNRSKIKEGSISVTGLGKADIVSDLIVWEGTFLSKSMDLKEAYRKLKDDKVDVTEYLKSKGINGQEIVFNSVTMDKKFNAKYNNAGKYSGDEFVGYELSQNVKIESKDVEKVEQLAREITELLNQGILFYSKPPRYYYTKLADLKIEMISKATEDAYLRAKTISQFSKSKIEKLLTAKMGIFQITGQNSNEDYSWGGTFNTSSKNKSASITMKLIYSTE